jgi:transcription antitermination factor NusG
VQLPYFPGYVFVHIAYRDRLLVLQTPGVVRFVGTRTSPAVVPDVQIEALQTALHLGLRVGPHSSAEIGRRVYIRSGPLLGTEGILLRRKGSCRVVVSIQAIMRAFAVEVNEQDIQPA